MSNSLAIAAVTATLRNLIQAAIQPVSAGALATTRPLDRAREQVTVDSVNLFLYRTTIDAAWRNTDLPGSVRPGELGYPPLPLTLSYLVTSYSESDDETISHKLLGRTMSALHDNAVLDRAAIQAALPNNDLYLQVEQVRVVPQTLDFEEISKLWTAFQTNYRISAAYDAAVVLIESTRGSTAPLPVLGRGSGDAGPTANASASVPVLRSVGSADGQLSARLGSTIVLTGQGLAGTAVSVVLANRQAGYSTTVAATSAGDTTIEAQLPDDPATVPAGIWTAAAIISQAGQPDWTTNELPFGVAPVVSNLPLTVARNAHGAAVIVLTCEPAVGPKQSCALVLGETSVPAPAPRTARQSSLTFTVSAAAPGSYLTRLRVDSIDSLLVDASTSPPTYDPSQQITIT